MSTSIHCGIHATNPDARWFIFCQGDVPEIKAQTLSTLRNAVLLHPDRAIIIPTTDVKRGNPVIFSCHFREQLLRLSGDEEARSLIRTHAKSVIASAFAATWVVSKTGAFNPSISLNHFCFTNPASSQPSSERPVAIAPSAASSTCSTL